MADIEKVFEALDSVRIAVLGDFCLDVYWHADMKKSRLSREVPQFPLPIVEERMSPGGAGNVAANAAALRPQSVTALGIIGNDWRGSALTETLRQAGVRTEQLIVSGERVTNTYIKPIRHGISDVFYEDPRLDFENDSLPSSEEESALLASLDSCDADVICVCDQMECGCVTDRVRERLCELGRSGKKIIVDSRDRIGCYRNVVVKPNEVEAGRLLGDGHPFAELTRMLSIRTERPAIVTLGEKGCVVSENGEVHEVPAVKVAPPVDICGAGDTFMAAFACVWAAGCSLAEAAFFANTASSVTVKKINTTGTATREELAAAWKPLS